MDELHDDEARGSLLSLPEADTAKNAPLLISALHHELSLVKSEQASRTPRDGTTGAARRAGGAGATWRDETAVCPPPPVAAGSSSLLLQSDVLQVDGLSLWEELGMATTEQSGLLDEDALEGDVKKSDRTALEERARSLLRQESLVLPTSAAASSLDPDNHALSLGEWDEIKEGWEGIESETAAEGSSLGEVAVHVTGGSSSGGGGGTSESASAPASRPVSLAGEVPEETHDDQMSASELRSRYQKDMLSAEHITPAWAAAPLSEEEDPASQSSRSWLLKTPAADFGGGGVEGGSTGVMAVNFDLKALKVSSENVGLGMKKLNA